MSRTGYSDPTLGRAAAALKGHTFEPNTTRDIPPHLAPEYEAYREQLRQRRLAAAKFRSTDDWEDGE